MNSSLDDLLDRFRRHERQALARLLTLAARGEESAALGDAAAQLLEDRGDDCGRVVALTGGGGVGKSSLIGRLVEWLRTQGQTVAVLACDPQSALTGGALLGDRIRMAGRAEDDGLFIRSLAAAGGRQALADNLDLMIALLLAYGFDIVLLETVGAGQGDTAVRELADVLVVLLQPESGDDIQWEKAGLLEVADVVVLNKSDLPGADRVEAQVRRELNLPGCRPVPVVKTSALKNEGLDELWSLVEAQPRNPRHSLLRLAERSEGAGQASPKGRIPPGKLPAELLDDLLRRYAVPADPRVVVGPRVGTDAAVIDFGDRRLVAKTDPVTFATDEIGWYAVHVNANDIACCGAVPRWFLATLLLPERSTTAELVEAIFSQMSRACRELEVSLCGGHTEITTGLDRPIVVGQMLGEAPTDRLVTSGGAHEGDALILTKGIAIEGTALIAREKWKELQGVLSADELRQSADLLHAPGISIVPEARLALEVGGVHALHDPTEGGLATGLWELAQASGVGLVIDEVIPLPECNRLCRYFDLDPLGLIASGALLIAAAADRAEPIVNRLKGEGISANVIGEIVPVEQGCSIRSPDGTLRPLPRFARDEIARLFG